MHNKYPQFSWSLSRHNTLMECPRRYAFAYYFAYGGWQKGASNFSKHIFRLKTLQSIHILYGSSIHNQIHGIVSELDNGSQMPTEQKIIAGVRSDLNQAYQESKNQQALWYEKPTDSKMLSEIYYDNELSLELIQELQMKLLVTTDNLLSCSTFHDLLQRRKQIKIIAAEKFRCMELNGAKVWVVMDLVYRDLEKGKYIIVDFKTGKKSNSFGDRTQLILYGKYIQNIFNLDDSLEQIELRNEYLQDGTSVNYTPKSFDFDSIDYQIQTSMDRMYTYLVDEENNTPKEIDSFDQTENISTCKRCSFKELCGRI
ncbi:PD-(D/E)XK nuclease family protein [Paenibacillus elgii]